jgi:membrane protease YdiL (CAAX protease family)
LSGVLLAAMLPPYNLQAGTVWSAGSIRPSRSWEEFLLVNIAALLLPAALISFGVLRIPAADLGAAPSSDNGGRRALVLYALMLPVMLIASRLPEFQQYYPMYAPAEWDGRALLYHELTYGAYLLCWEAFFRGYLTFGLKRGFGDAWAVVLQAALFGLMHIGKPLPEVIGSFIAGVVLGVLALRSRSFLPCFLVHWACSATFDLLVIWAKPGGVF